MPNHDDLIAVESARGGTGVVSLASAPFTAEQTQSESLPERRPEKAIVIGHDGSTFRGVAGDADIDDFTGREFRVLVPDVPAWFSGLRGGPVIIDGRVRGIVSAVNVPRMGDTGILNVIGAVRIQDLLRRVLERKQTAQRAEPAAQHAEPAAQAPAGESDAAGEAPDPPAWLLDVCVTINLPGDVGAPATGLVVGDRLIVSTATRLRGLRTFTVVTRSRVLEARMLDFATDGPLVFLGLTGTDRFEATAPLIRPRTRVRTATDPPDPADAMLVVARDGLRTWRVPDASNAGVVKSRDPSGYRFDVVIGERVESFDDFTDAVVVWGDTVAGILVPTSGGQLRRRASSIVRSPTTFQVVSVNVIRDSVDGATDALRRLESPVKPRAYIASVPGSVQRHADVAREQLQKHGLVTTRLDLPTFGPTLLPEVSREISVSDLFVLIVGQDRGYVPEGETRSIAELELEIAHQAGVYTLVFLSRDDSGVSDPRHLAWREELESRYLVGTFDESPESLHLDESIVHWQKEGEELRELSQREEALSPEDANVTTNASADAPHVPDDRSAPSGYHCAKVVICGDSYTGKSEILGKIPGLRRDQEHGGFRGVLWTDRLESAPALRAGLVFYESSSDQNWPLALDLEDAALAMIVVALGSGIEGTTNAQLSRVRAANQTVPVLIVLTYPEGQEEAQYAVLSWLSEIARRDAQQRVTSGRWLRAGGVVAVSEHGPQGVDRLIDETFHHIDWNRQPVLGPEDFEAAQAQVQTIFSFQPREDLARLSTSRRPEWLVQLGRLLGERTFASDDILIRHPALFNRVVLRLIEGARQQTRGLPAVRLKEIKEDSGWSIKPDAVIRAVAKDLVRRQLAMVVEKTSDAVFVLPALFDAAAEISVPAEAKPILRAQWTGSGRDVFIEVLVHYAYALGNTVEGAWQRSLSRGSGRVSTEPPLYVQVTETGEIAELLASAAGPSDYSRIDEATRHLREALESIMSGNASLSVDPSPSS